MLSCQNINTSTNAVQCTSIGYLMHQEDTVGK